MKRPGHQVCLLLGSNIRPEYHLPLAVALLRQELTILRVSSVWESAPVGGQGPNYLNAAMLAISQRNALLLKKNGSSGRWKYSWAGSAALIKIPPGRSTWILFFSTINYWIQLSGTTPLERSLCPKSCHPILRSW
jgi:hypothetical protein